MRFTVEAHVTPSGLVVDVPSSIRRVMAPAAVVLGLLAALTGCGSDSSGAEFTIVASELQEDPYGAVGYAFEGDEVTSEAPTITVEVGQEVTLNLVNRSGQYSSSPGSHDVAIVPEIDDVFLAIAAREITGHVVWDAITPTISADETASITFVPDEPGTYHYLCTVPGHAQHGMIGTLVVEE